MPVSDVVERSPLRALHGSIGGALLAGELGLLYAEAGGGKSALLVQMALERLLRGARVLHVAVRDSVPHVRDAYESGLGGLRLEGRALDRAQALLRVEQQRVVHATRGAPFDAARLRTLLTTLADVLDFVPELVVVDGAEPEAPELEALREAAATCGVAVWVAFTPTRPVPEAPQIVAVELRSEGSRVRAHVRRDRRGGSEAPSVLLAERTHRARATPTSAPPPAAPLRPRDCTLYSGGAHGAEAAFGEHAERWGVREVNYTFHGHVQARTRGAHPLTEQSLSAGDVSLAWVSRRLRRSYAEGGTIRRVLQSLWHQVSSAQVVFVIGAIQEDGTVTGGTGWSVELARMWNKRLWVFDQDKEGWYRWAEDAWQPGTPTIETDAFCGTGTRYLTESGRGAIAALFERSYGAPPPDDA